ncbi:MAG: hypothetical protein KDB02_04635 [Acidimicrobiales bacterium]|nr:hypothetical protein [Acidimicrobiales bacterium]
MTGVENVPSGSPGIVVEAVVAPFRQRPKARHRSIKVTPSSVATDREDFPIYIGDHVDHGAGAFEAIAAGLGLPQFARGELYAMVERADSLIVGYEVRPDGSERRKLYLEFREGIRDERGGNVLVHEARKWEVARPSSVSTARYFGLRASDLGSASRLGCVLSAAASPLVDGFGRLLDRLWAGHDDHSFWPVLFVQESEGERSSVDVDAVGSGLDVAAAFELAARAIGIWPTAGDATDAVAAVGNHRLDRIGFGVDRTGEHFVTFFHRAPLEEG